MTTLAGTEPSTLFGMSEVLGVGSPEALKLAQEMVKRMSMMSDPNVQLVNNPELSQSIQTTSGIAGKLIDGVSSTITAAVDDQAAAKRTEAIRDSVVVGAVMVLALLVVLYMARTLIRPLRRLRNSALKVAHEDLVRELDEVRSGAEVTVRPLPVQSTEEIGQVAHAVDELHEQAVLLAGEQARLQLQVSDMFETLSRRSRSLIDQQLTVIDQLERDEQDPQRLSKLFRLDHLAARMRRIGANLLVLALEVSPVLPGAAMSDAPAERAGTASAYGRLFVKPTSVPRSRHKACVIASEISRVESLYHPVLLQAISQGEAFRLDRWLEYVQPSIQHNLPTGIRDDVTGMSSSG